MINAVFLIISAVVFYLFPAGFLNAEEGIFSLDIEGQLYVIASPNHWDKVTTREPFDYKFVHEDGKRECFVKFTCFDETIDEDVIFADLLTSAEALYGKGFWKGQAFFNGVYDSNENGLKQWYFRYTRGNNLESVVVLAFPEFSVKNCCQCIIFVTKIDVNSSQAEIEAADNASSVDFSSFLKNISFFPNTKS